MRTKMDKNIYSEIAEVIQEVNFLNFFHQFLFKIKIQ